MAGYRIDRITEDIKRELIAILREVKDPRVSGMLTVVKVDVSNDLSYAKVYISALEGVDKAKEAVKGLKAAQDLSVVASAHRFIFAKHRSFALLLMTLSKREWSFLIS